MAQRRTAKQIPRSEAAGAARIYADPKNTCTYRELMQILEASKGTVYTVLDNAVIQHMVDDKVVQQMEEKARFNEDRLHEGKGTRRTEVHYNVLREKRKKYELSEKAAIQIIMMYAETDETRQEFCEREGISKELFNKIMMQYIVTKKVDDDTFEKLAKKGVKNNFSKQTIAFWNLITEKRKSNLGQG